MPLPAAATITVRATLTMLDEEKREIADGVANDQYVFWLGSGISRDRMPDLRGLAKKVLVELQAQIVRGDPNCRFRKALTAVLNQASPSAEEWDRIDFDKVPDNWADFEAIAARLVNNYARMLNVTVDGEEQEYILWDILQAAHVYSDPAIEPDVEHLCLAALGIEGVVSNMPTANWDTLIERAVKKLAGDQPVLRVVVAPDHVRLNPLRANLYKFHGCAQCAVDDEENFRGLLVARSSQINGWAAHNPIIAAELRRLILSRPTLMLGLSAQDSNIQGLFADAQTAMAWAWPSHPPAYAFSENALGADQESLLQNVYHGDYNAQNRPAMEAEALVRAYAKPLLLALYLYIITAKLKTLVELGTPEIGAAERDKLHEGLEHARNVMAECVSPDAATVTELIEHCGRTLSLLRSGTPLAPARGIYSPLTAEPLHRMPADMGLPASGLCEFAIANGLIGLGLARGHWTASKADPTDPTSGAMVLDGRSGPARIYFAANAQAAIMLGINGHISNDEDTVIIHSHIMPPPLARYPRRAPGRTGLSTSREISIQELLTVGTDVEGMLDRFRRQVAL